MARHKEAEKEKITAETRRALLDAAAEAFARDGFEAANINRISLTAGFAKGTIYNYFPSKRDLMLAVIEDIASDHVNYIMNRVEPVEGPEGRLTEFFDAGFTWVVKQTSRARVMITMLYGPDEAFRTHMYQAYLPLFQFVAEQIINQGIAQGRFRHVGPMATAGLLMTIYLGTASQTDEEGRTWLDPAQVSDFAIHALKAQGSG
jgi:TetR/AcrR family fatty acid metabolism transcriptional regulator